MSAEATVRVSKIVPASPQWVFDAWLDPSLVARWMTPGGVRAEVEIDRTTGGRYLVRQFAGGSLLGGFEAEIVELDEPRRLRWVWGFVGPDRAAGGPRYDSELTVTLTASGSGTRVELVHEQLADLRAALPWVADRVDDGWTEVLQLLSTLASGSQRESN